jgi:hypothetical protein
MCDYALGVFSGGGFMINGRVPKLVAKTAAVILIGITLIGSLMIGVSAIGAAQNAGLSAQIISDPMANGVSFPSQQEAATATALMQAEGTVAQQYGFRVTVAAAGWHQQSSTKEFTNVDLIGFSLPSATSSPSDMASFVQSASSSASSTICPGATGEPDVTNTPIAAIPDSHQVRCSPVAGRTVVAVVFAKENVLVLMGSTVSTQLQLAAIALQQYHKLASTPVAVPAAASHAWVWVLVALGAVLVVAAATVVAVRTHRKIARLESRVAEAERLSETKLATDRTDFVAGDDPLVESPPEEFAQGEST